ncbi:hypothetical protein [Spartinivicinus ruber]|uniref:hypothetical protein n=1 Tax=Spartinivicinus ruber TaxID=2683272 RepID=UPI0013D5548B|nr:hypothetical protein [Spartinivicinus ruber]
MELSFKAKLGLSYIVFLTAIIIIGVAGILSITAIEKNYDSTIELYRNISIENKAKNYINNLLNTTDKEEVKELENKIIELKKESETLDNSFRKNTLNTPNFYDDFYKICINIIKTHKQYLNSIFLFKNNYPKEKELRYQISDDLYKLNNPEINIKVGKIQYYSKEMLYQYKDESHLNKWLDSIDNLKNKINTDNTKIITKLNEYYNTAKNMGFISIELKEYTKEKKKIS